MLHCTDNYSVITRTQRVGGIFPLRMQRNIHSYSEFSIYCLFVRFFFQFKAERCVILYGFFNDDSYMYVFVYIRINCDIGLVCFFF